MNRCNEISAHRSTGRCRYPSHMTNLVPERRTDKRGVTSTRWVKPQDSKTSQSTDLPSPVVVASAAQRPDMHKIIHALYGPQRLNAGERMVVQHNVKLLNNYYPDLMDRIMEACSQEGEEQFVWLTRLKRDNLTSTRKGEEADTRKNVERALVVYPYTLRIVAGNVHESWEADFMRSYDHAVELMVRKEGREVSDRKMEAMALACHVCQMRPNDDSDLEAIIARDVYEKVADDLEYISENLEAVEKVLPILRERESYSSGFLREIVENESAALAEGIL